jgi:hypothetical protein
MVGFGTVLDDSALSNPSAVSTLVYRMTDAGMVYDVRLVIPGDPDHSRLYQLVAGRVMPPAMTPYPPGSTEFSAPTVSDLTILRSWIFCLGGLGPEGPSGASLPVGDPNADGGPAGEAGSGEAGARNMKF